MHAHKNYTHKPQVQNAKKSFQKYQLIVMWALNYKMKVSQVFRKILSYFIFRSTMKQIGFFWKNSNMHKHNLICEIFKAAYCGK